MASRILLVMGRATSSKSLQERPIFNQRKQVAAVCYRIGKRGVQFLLVQTRSGRWIFPKGGVEHGLTYAQSAALEAFEEAGVHGRIEEIPFTRYFRRRPDTNASLKNTGQHANSAHRELAVTAYLCEVTRLEAPQESNRNPTWFSAEKAKQWLVEDRSREFGAELARVIDLAVARVERLHQGLSARVDQSKADPRMRKPMWAQTRMVQKKDALQEVRFEASEIARAHRLSGTDLHPNYILRGRPVLQLPSGSGSSPAALQPDAPQPEAPQNVQFIDGGRPARRQKVSPKSL